MSQFRLLTRARQATEYSCGASALQAVLSYWGTEVSEQDLMRLLHTTSAEGTYPADIVRVALDLGFEAEARENLTLEEVQVFTATGHPLIALAQVWRSEKDTAASVEDEWDTGHYVVILGVDKDYVYFQDPFARMGKAFVPRKAFEEHWHQIMGGDPENNPRLMHLGILIRGLVPIDQSISKLFSLTAIDFQRFGSLNLMIAQFPRILLPYDFLDELSHIWADGSIRPDAFIFLRKDRDGNVMGMEGSRLHEEEDIASINVVLAAIVARAIGSPELAGSKAQVAADAAAIGDFGLSAEDIQGIARKLPENHSAIVILFENVWERSFKAITERHGGSLIKQRLVLPDDLAAAARVLARTNNT